MMKQQLLSKELSVTTLALAAAVITSITFSVATRYLPRKKEGKDTNKNITDSDDINDIYKIITTRRTINAFEPELPVDWETILKKSIGAAITAPNHKRTEPWRFYVPNRDVIKSICELNASIVAKGSGGSKSAEAKLKKWLNVPGWVVVTCIKEGEDEHVNMDDPKGRQRENYAAVCCAIQNMCLSLHADGLGTKWTTGKVNFHEEFNTLVGIPKTEFVVGTIWFGTPSKIPSPKATKMSIEDVLTIAN
jgi:nitroreductase